MQQQDDWSKCWLCIRTTPQKVLEASHKLFPKDPEKAHQVGMLAATILKDAYTKSPPALCGKTTKALVGGALYIACLQLNHFKSQRVVADVMDLSEVPVRSAYQLIARTLGILADWPETYRKAIWERL